jgi:hypothetical protein
MQLAIDLRTQLVIGSGVVSRCWEGIVVILHHWKIDKVDCLVAQSGKISGVPQ